MTKNSYASFAASISSTVQTAPIPGRSDMVQNNEGGFVFSVTPFDRLDRFLILGTDTNTYYASANKLTATAANHIIDLIKSDGQRVLDRVIEISTSNRAPKNDPALFVMALLLTYGNETVRKTTAYSIGRVARTGTHLLHLAEYVNGMRGWGRTIRDGFSRWYTERPELSLVQQVTKYANRDGWTHRDVLRLAHTKPNNATQNEIFQYIIGKDFSAANFETECGRYLNAVIEVKTTENVKDVIRLIRDFKLPREVIPTQFLNDPRVWDALLPHMGSTALVRNLGKMSSLSMTTPLSTTEKFIVDRLTDSGTMRADRMHPLTLLIAKETYGRGRGTLGNNQWTVSNNIVAALETAFYDAFDAVEPTRKNQFIAIDCSGSMHSGHISNTVPITPAQAAAVMAMVSIRAEPYTFITGFGSRLVPLDINKSMTLNQVLKKINMSNFGATDCSAPMKYARANKLEVDAFSVYTDNETYAGRIHPAQSLQKYRVESGRPAKLAVVGMTATNFTIADPTDNGMMDFCGFDTAAPSLIANFFRG